jgi:hypothetical protein
MPLMADCVYQVRVAGLVPPDELHDELVDVSLEAHQFRTVLIGRFAQPGALVEFLRQLRGLGLEIVDVRKLPAHLAELTVAGECGSELHALLHTYEVAVSELHTLLRARVPEEVGYRDLVLLLESRGLKIASIAPVGADAQVPTPRAVLDTPANATVS